MDKDTLQILHDHYKDTFSHIQQYLKLRDKLFLLILGVITLMLFQVYSPAQSGEAVSQFITKHFDLKSPIDIEFFSSIIWFALLSLVARYFQTVVHIERQYSYIHNLEDILSPSFENKAFTREGKAYLTNYPLFSNWTWILYTVIFPILLLIVVVVKIVGEIKSVKGISWLLGINIAIFLCVIISTLLYMLLVHFKK
jgi:hypothetical protein